MGSTLVELLVDSEHESINISVSDFGIGMSEDLISRLFRPFENVRSDVCTVDKPGLGLGLSIVKGIAELHGGSVTAVSAGETLGSTFAIHLPVERVLKSSSLELSKEKLAPQIIRRVLVIEDSLDLQMLIRIMLELEGHEVLTASSGAEGVSLALSSRPDVILCDIGLPDNMSGYDVAKILRDTENLNSTYLIAMTGFGRETDRQQARRSGFNYHLTKPIDSELLRKVVSELPSF